MDSDCVLRPPFYGWWGADTRDISEDPYKHKVASLVPDGHHKVSMGERRRIDFNFLCEWLDPLDSWICPFRRLTLEEKRGGHDG